MASPELRLVSPEFKQEVSSFRVQVSISGEADLRAEPPAERPTRPVPGEKTEQRTASEASKK